MKDAKNVLTVCMVLWAMVFCIAVTGVATCHVVYVDPMPVLELAKVAAHHDHWYQWNLLLTR